MSSEDDLIIPTFRRKTRSSPRDRRKKSSYYESDSGQEKRSLSSDAFQEDSVSDDQSPSDSDIELAEISKNVTLDEDEDHFQLPVPSNKGQRKKRVIESDSSDLSPLQEDSLADKNLPEVTGRVKKNKKKIKAKYDIFEGHPELLTVWKVTNQPSLTILGS